MVTPLECAKFMVKQKALKEPCKIQVKGYIGADMVFVTMDFGEGIL